jgi:hypothetical protein
VYDQQGETAGMTESVGIGKIVRSESHVRYTCQIYAPGEVARPPEPADYAFGTFVRIPLRAGHALPDVAPLALPAADAAPMPPADALALFAPPGMGGATSAVGLIYDTLLLNPEFGTLGPRLSNDAQVELFSPDYVSERAVLVLILLLGTVTSLPGGALHVSHGVPPVAPDLGAEVAALPDNAVRAFHYFADGSAGPGGPKPYLHMGYLPHAIAQDNPLLPMAILRTVERLERLLPESAALLTIVKRNFAWRLKVQTAG